MFARPLSFERRGAVAEQPSRFLLHDHLRDHILNHLELADLLAELHTLVRVLNRRLAAGASETHGSGAATEPRVVQIRHANLEAVAFLAQHVFLRHLAIVEEQLAVGEAFAPSLSSMPLAVTPG